MSLLLAGALKSLLCCYAAMLQSCIAGTPKQYLHQVAKLKKNNEEPSREQGPDCPSQLDWLIEARC